MLGTTKLVRLTLSRLKSDAGFVTILVGASIALALKILAAGSTFLLTLVIARQLGAEQAGYFFLAFSIVNVLAALGRYGYDNALVRYIAVGNAVGDYPQIRGLYRLALTRSTLICTVLAMVLYHLAAPMAHELFNKPAAVTTLKLAALSLAPVSLTFFHAYVFQGMQKVTYSIFFLSVSIPFGCLTGIWLFALKGADTALSAMLVSSLFSLFCAVILWWRLIGNGKSTLLPTQRYEFQRSARRLFSVNLCRQILLWGSPLLLGAWTLASDLAVFTIAQRTAMLTSFVLVAVNAIAAPNFAALYAQGSKSELRSMALNSTRLLIVSGLPIFLFIILFSDWLMGLFGKEFLVGGNCLIILACGQFVNLCTGSVAYLLQMTGNENLLRNNLIVSAVIIVVGGWLIIPTYGILGAAIVTGTSVAVQNLLGVWQVRRILGFNTMAIWQR